MCTAIDRNPNSNSTLFGYVGYLYKCTLSVLCPFSLKVLRITPPMCITRPDVDYAVAVIRKVLQDYTNQK